METEAKYVRGQDIVQRGSFSAACCPFIGLKHDSATAMGFPDEANHCYGHKNVSAIAIDTQSELCLTNHYDTCPIYKTKVAKETAGSAFRVNARRWFRRLLFLTPVLLIFTASLVWWPDPGAIIVDFTTYAKTLTEMVEEDNNSQPLLSQELVAKKEKNGPAYRQRPITSDAMDAGAAAAPAEEKLTTQPSNTDAEFALMTVPFQQDHHYRVLTYD